MLFDRCCCFLSRPCWLLLWFLDFWWLLLVVRSHLMFKSLGQFLTLSWYCIQEWGQILARSYDFYHTLQYQVDGILPACRILKEFESEFASSISLETPIWRAPRLWCLPSQVGKGFVFPFGRKYRSPFDPESSRVLILLLGRLLRGCLLTLEDWLSVAGSIMAIRAVTPNFSLVLSFRLGC